MESNSAGFPAAHAAAGGKVADRSRAYVGAFRVTFVLLIIYCVVGAALVVLGTATLVHNPWENTLFESPQTYAAIHAAQTGQLYIPMSEPPYTPQAYTPLYYAMNGAIAWTAHLDIDRFILYARLAAFSSYLLCGVLVFMICRAAAVSILNSAMAGLLMLGQPDFLGWNVSPRPDMFYLLAMLVSLYCVVRWQNRLYLGYALAGFFASVAFLIKQPGLAVSASIFIVLILQRDFKKAVIFSISAIVPVLVVFSVLYLRHDPFFAQASFAGKSYWSVGNAVQFAQEHMYKSFWIVPACIGTLGLVRAIRLGTREKMIAAFALANVLMGLAGMPQLGAYMNYLLPGMAGCALLLPYALEMTQRQVHLTTSLLVASAALLWTMAATVTQTKYSLIHFRPPTNNSLTWLGPYRILSDSTAMNMHGRDPNLLDPFGAHVLELRGYWDSTPVVSALQHGDYDLIILTRIDFRHVVFDFRGISYFSPDEIRIINDKYEVLCSTMSAMVLKPRGREVTATPEMFGRLMLNEPCVTGLRRFPLTLKLASGAR